METRFETLAPTRVAYLRAVGPYQKTFPVIWPKVRKFAARRGLADAVFLSIAHNNPRTTPTEQIVGDACVVVPESFVLDPALDGEADLRLQTIPAGRYFVARYEGPYERLAGAWGEFCDRLLPASGHATCAGLPFEIYVIAPAVGRQPVTDLYMPIA